MIKCTYEECRNYNILIESHPQKCGNCAHEMIEVDND